MEIKGFAQTLAEYMTEMSRKYYGSSWMDQLEFELWNELSGEDDMLEPEEIAKLKQLSQNCDGWIMKNLREDNLSFMTLGSWREFYRANKPF
ncbi:MAG: hypothetical protein QNL04_02350 [SAR324 cluster bacterium]|nr:hypothetical protein [SAR324 cluster bacterium]